MRASTALRAALCIVTCLVFVPGLATAQPGSGPELTLETFTATDAAHPGEALRTSIAVTVPEGWHVNAHKPLEDFLIATAVTFDASGEGLAIAESVYPEPDEFKFAGTEDVLLVYGGTFHIGFIVDVPDSVAPGAYTLTGSLRYQACNDTQCWAPDKIAVALPVKVVPAETPVTPQHEDVFASIAFGGPAAPGQPESPSPAESPTPATSSAEWSGLLPRFTIAAQTGGYLGVEDFTAFIDAAESGTPQQGYLEGKALWAVVGLTLLGGLLLNLTPCVLPLIPINLTIIGAGAQSGSRSRGFALGGLYGLGICLVYGILGLIVVLGLGSFGTINASPWFNFAIAVVFVALGLALFDLFVIDFTHLQQRIGIKKEKGSFVFAFLMGALNALLAGACVAPVVIAVILYSQDAYAKGSALGLALPFLLGVGMALPWPFAGGGLSLMPKPGKWMVTVKYAFGVFIIAMGLYYGYLGVTLFSDRYLVDREAVRATAEESVREGGWHDSLSGGLALAEAENKPVIIDFWATWCKNCLTMDKTTLKDESVRDRLEGYVKIKYQAEQPAESPTKEVLAHFDAYVGLPHYAILKPSP
jgi:thioredoxin:protein disulfide reductase